MEPLFFNPIFSSLNQVSAALRIGLLEQGISKVCHLRRSVDWVPEEQLAEMVGRRSVRLVSQVLNRLKSDLSAAVQDYLDVTPVEQCQTEECFFPELVMDLGWEDWQEGQGMLLTLRPLTLGLFSTLQKGALYTGCIKALNFHSLRDLRETKWTEVVGANSSPKGSWRSMYKRPTEKRVGDLQCRIVHGIIATNRHAARIDPSLGDGCPFCGVSETVFHMFLNLIKDWGTRFLGFFNEILFIYGPKYSVAKKIEW